MDRTKLVEAVAGVLSKPVYKLVGLTEGNHVAYKLISPSEASLQLLGLENDELIEIDRGRIGLAASSRESKWIVYEKIEGPGSTLYAARVANGEKIQIEGIEDHRVTGLALSRKTAVVSASSLMDFKIFVIDTESWSVEYSINVDKPVFVSSVKEPIATGVGHLHGDPRSTELFVVNLDQGSFIDYTPGIGSNNRSPKIGDGKILFASALSVKEELLVLDYESMTLSKPEIHGVDYKKDDLVEYIDFGWIDNGKVWFIGLSKGSSRAYIDGRRLSSPDGSLVRAEWTGEALIAEHSSFDTPNSIIAITDKKHKQLVPRQRETIKSVSKWTLNWIESVDGLRVPVWSVKSADNNGGSRKAVVYVHGGPFKGVYNEWNPIVALFASLGYNVIIPNYRGSRGFGEHYRRMLIGDPGRGDVYDVLSATRWARNVGLADKVAILGFSYGGYLALMAALKDPGSFDAVAVGHVIVDWEYLYENGSVLLKRFIDILFDGRRDLMKTRAPKNMLDRLEQPVCIVQPDNDELSPLEPVLNTAIWLTKLGKRFELHVINNTGHNIYGGPEAYETLAYIASFIERKLAT